MENIPLTDRDIVLNSDIFDSYEACTLACELSQWLEWIDEWFTKGGKNQKKKN